MRWEVLVFTSLLTALPGCDRDFELPPPKDDKPEFLGEFAGTYVFSLDPRNQVAGGALAVPIPVSGMLQHLPGARGEPDVVAGFFFEDRLDLAAVQPDVCATSDAFLPGTPFSIDYQDGKGTGTLFASAGDQSLELTRLAGGRILTLEFRICDGAPVEKYFASRTCEFDSTLSGVFDGISTDCATGVETEAILALGVRELPPLGTLVMAIKWPRIELPPSDQVLFGTYGHFSETGLLGHGQSSGLGVSMFTLSETDGVLRLDYAGEDLVDENCEQDETCHDCVQRLARGVCAQIGVCEGFTPSCGERFSGTRASGRGTESCEFPARWALRLGAPQLDPDPNDTTQQRVFYKAEITGFGLRFPIADLLARQRLQAELLNLTTGQKAVPVADTVYQELKHRSHALGFLVDRGADYYLRVAGTVSGGVIFVAALPRCMTVPN